MKYFLLLIAAVLSIFAYACKTRPQPVIPANPVDPSVMEKMWKTVDSLEQKGLTASALEEVRSIKQLALAGKNSGHLIKAVVHENRYLIQLEEDSALKALERAESEMESFPEPARSVMHSLAAQWYSTYMQSHLWDLRNRTEFGGPAGPDIRTWGIRHFIDRIQSHYQASVQWDGLKAAEVGDYQMLLTDGQETDELRPVLYDILMHRTLDFYSSSESYLTRTPYDFTLNDPLAFSAARSFVGHVFSTEDSISSAWQALQWYQQLLAFRLTDSSHPAALLDADLKRLRFVYDQGVMEGKDSLYQHALVELSISYKDNPESALVDYYRAELLVSQAGQWQASGDGLHRYVYNDALEICNKALTRFPDAYGSRLCKTLIAQIEQKSISAGIESINLPGEDLLARIEYRNISSVFLKVVRLPESPRRWKGESWEGDELLRKLNQLTAVKSWKQLLDDGKDHQSHSTEIALSSLPLGHYALVVSDVENFEPNSSTTGTVMFSVSSLAYWFLDDNEQNAVAAVVDRSTGQPIAGAKVEFFSYEYNAQRRQQQEVKLGDAVGDANGWVNVPEHDNRNLSIRVTKGSDELFLDDTYYSYRYGRRTTSNPTTLFFSDRSIYRPGQKVYFKAYALEFDADRMPSIVAGRNVDATLYDANGKEVTRQTFKSNEYGTFSGYFDLPSAGLTGQMSISSSHGGNRHYFRVEEYKRPRFEITFDTLAKTVRLNDEVVVRAYAKDYAGSAVSGAIAGYRVERVAYRPWWYGYWKGYWPSGDDRQVLSTGRLTSNLDGSMDIPFVAKGKPGDHDLMYRFEITVFVTDITGESHEAVKSIVINKQGFDVNIRIAEQVPVDQWKNVAVSALNSDGKEVKINGQITVTLLQGPIQNKRNRLWANPDILTLTDQEYATRLGSYYVPGKEQMSAWPALQSLGTQKIAVDGHGSVDLSALIKAAGYYKLEWSWTDASGIPLQITQYVMTYARDKALPGQEATQVWFDDQAYQPGGEVTFSLLSVVMSPPKAIRIVERRTQPSQRMWMSMPLQNDHTIILTDTDRGGVIVHHLAVYNNRFYATQHTIRVPWSNKELQVNLKTWRDQLEPGDDETWTLTVEGTHKEKIAAELVLSMYDASLDAFVSHEWQMNLFPVTASRQMVRSTQPTESNYWGLSYHWDQTYQDPAIRQYRDLNTYGYYPEGGYYPMPRGSRRYKNGDTDMMLESVQAGQATPASAPMEDAASESIEKKDANNTGGHPVEKSTPPPLRSALDETVFFFPQIMTDAQGQLTFNFKMKEGLTRWKFQALAHTRDLAFGLTEAEVVTRKSLMIFPNPPRFFREGDTIAFQAKVSNTTAELLQAKANLKILDAFSGEDVSARWGLTPADLSLSIQAMGSAPAVWMLKVPSTWTRPVKYQIYAVAGAHTDGEEALLPVVTNRILITETLPLPLKAKENKTFVFRSMMDNRTSGTTDHRYVVEMTSSPAWYAVQALPYLMEYPHECAEQMFSRLYANTLAAHIVQSQPEITKVYNAWRMSGDDALVSNLQKNQELKSAMLEETPWIRDAMGETQQKKDIALLFETNRLRYESQQTLEKLRQMQLSNGGFPWFPGGEDNWYITQYIMEGFGHLQKMGVTLSAGTSDDIIQKAIPYLDARMIEWYNDLKKEAAKGKLKMEDHQIGSMQVHYLYTRSFFPDVEHPAALDEINMYVKSQIEKYWLEHGIFDQGLMASGMHRMWPESKVAKDILASLRQRTIYHEELGRYWKLTSGYQWNEAAIELQALMIELYQDMSVPQSEVDELRVWLLKQKQTTQWKTTKATASAIYALLIHPDAWLESVGIAEVTIGDQKVISQADESQAGSGYIKKSWEGTAIQPSWSTINVNNPNAHIAWGSAYWQHWEDIDKVKSAVDNNPLKISRSLLIVRDTDRGEVTDVASSRALKVGDKLIVRLVIETDRPMDFVHLKDVRASGFEPVDVLSGYRWKGGIGYYQSTKDLATHFFIDRLPRGKYVVEYEVTVAQAGAYSEGLATLQCMYAPEYAGHSAGSRVMVHSR